MPWSAFTIDACGPCHSRRAIARSSGNAELDRAALDMVRRSSPVPAPPEGETTRSLVVPVAFNLEERLGSSYAFSAVHMRIL